MNHSVFCHFQWIRLDANILETMPRKTEEKKTVFVRVDEPLIMASCVNNSHSLSVLHGGYMCLQGEVAHGCILSPICKHFGLFFFELAANYCQLLLPLLGCTHNIKIQSRHDEGQISCCITMLYISLLDFFSTICTKEKKIPIKLLYLEMKSPVHAMRGQTQKLGGARPRAPTTCRAYGVLFGCTHLHGQTSSRNTVYSKMQTMLQSCPQEPMTSMVQPFTSFQPYPVQNLHIIGTLEDTEDCCKISASNMFSPKIKVSILALRELQEERQSGEDKRKTQGGRRERETAGSMPCPLSMTFLVNSSYDFFPPLLFRWEKDGESQDEFKHCNKPPFYFCPSPFL